MFGFCSWRSGGTAARLVASRSGIVSSSDSLLFLGRKIQPSAHYGRQFESRYFLRSNGQSLTAFVQLFHLTSGRVLQAVREFLPGLISPYREENRFQFQSLRVKPKSRAQTYVQGNSEPTSQRGKKKTAVVRPKSRSSGKRPRSK